MTARVVSEEFRAGHLKPVSSGPLSSLLRCFTTPRSRRARTFERGHWLIISYTTGSRWPVPQGRQVPASKGPLGGGAHLATHVLGEFGRGGALAGVPSRSQRGRRAQPEEQPEGSPFREKSGQQRDCAYRIGETRAATSLLQQEAPVVYLPWIAMTLRRVRGHAYTARRRTRTLLRQTQSNAFWILSVLGVLRRASPAS